jgi:hypothetical protein
LAIEDHYADFHSFYHTTSDTLQYFNVPYFTSFVRASLGTVAHLALPVTCTPFDIVAVASTAATPGNGIGAGSFYAQHDALATESGADPLDQARAEAPANTNAVWLKIETQPYGTALRQDARPLDSETLFAGALSVLSTGAPPLFCTNQLRFDFLTPPQADRLYFARIHISGSYTATSNDFNCVTNIRSLVDSGGYLDLPTLINTRHGVPYGTCEIASRFLNTASSNCSLQIVSMAGSWIVFAASAQLGVQTEDQIEVNTNLLQTNGWQPLTSALTPIAPTDDSFESGWTTVMLETEASSLTNSQSFYFRLKRLWSE